MMDALPRLRGRVRVLTAFVCLLCTLPYWRALFLPAISDDYLQVSLGRKYLHFSTWPDLASDALYRCRATSIWLTGLIDTLFGSSGWILNFQSLTLHALNVALVASLGRFEKVGYRISLPAALLWGFNERHHEAVMWYAALPELLVFLFVLLTLLFWLEWWQKEKPAWYFASMLCFVLALMSKESAVITCALILLPLVYEPRRWRQALRGLIPFLALSIIYYSANMLARENHLHWNDGTFRIGWHFVPVIFNSAARLLTVWGLAAIVLLIFKRRQVDWRLPLIACMWIPIALAPYSFVAYQPRVPSRHVYLASIGVAFLLAIALEQLAARRLLANTVLAAYICFNTSYIWFYKHNQFLERAAVTEQLVLDAERLTSVNRSRLLEISCFPLSHEIASLALSQRLNIDAANVVFSKRTTPNCGKPVVYAVLD